MKNALHRLAVTAGALLLALSLGGRIFADTLPMQRAEMKAILEQISRKISQEYYDPTLHGVDWNATLAEARKKIDAANDPGEMLTAIFAVLDSLHDSHTLFIPPYRTQYAVFGFEVKMYGDEARISEIKPNSVAARAGLQPGDRVLKLNGYPPTRKNLDVLLTYYRVLRPVGQFQLETQRDDEAPRTVRMGGEIHVRPAVADLSLVNEPYELVREVREAEDEAQRNPFRYSMQGDVGYIALPHFRGDPSFLRTLLKKVEHAKAIVVDLRGNGGGSIDSLETMAGFFEPRPTELGSFVGRKKTEPIKVKPQNPNISAPMFILVDSESASASEIFARHFQRERHATVIGDRTSGSVMIASIFPSHIGGDIVISYATEITVGRMVMTSGEELENKGVTPDEACVPTPEQMRKGADPCLARAFALATKSIAPASPAAASAASPGR